MNTLQFPSHWSRIRKLLWLKILSGASAVWSTISGNPVSFTAKAAPLKQLSVAFSPVQTGTGDPSPDNVRPILGWDSLNVEQRGKNLLDESSLVYGAIANNGSFSQSSTKKRSDYIFVKAGTYTASRKTAPDWWKAYQYKNDSDKTPVGFAFNASVTLRQTFTLSEDCFIAFSFDYIPSEDANLQLELGTERTDFTPYNPLSRSISISLGETVYSGYVDVVTGVVRVNKVKAVLDGTGNKGASVTTVEQQTISSGTAWLVLLNRILAFSVMPKYGGINNIDCICNLLKQGNNNAIYMQLGQFNTSGSYFRLVLPDQTLDTKKKVNAWLANNPIELCYEVAEPFTIQLTPQEVESLAGDNTMWTDADSLTVEYRSN